MAPTLKLRLVALVFAAVVSAESSSSSGFGASVQVGAGSNSAIKSISAHDEEITEVLTQLEDLADVALHKLGPTAAEIDIDVVFEDSGSRDATDSIVNTLPTEEEADDDDDDDGDEEDDNRFTGDEWVVVVPRTNAPVPCLPFDDDSEAKHGDGGGGVGVATAFATNELPSQAPIEPKQQQQAPYTTHLWPEWQQQQQGPHTPDDDWAALFAPNDWGVDYRQFDQWQLLGPANLAVLTAVTSVVTLLVLGIWSLSRRAQRRRAVERQNQWAVSVELLDAMPYYETIV